jgi:protein disulfide-isomerase A1
MRTTRLIACWTSVLAAADLIKDPTQADFDNLLQGSSTLLVAFTSQTMETIRSFNNDFGKIAANSSTPFVTINCDTETLLCNKYDINSYPAIRLFDRDHELKMQMSRYRGPRTPKALASLVKKRELPVLSHLQTASDMSFRGVDPFVLIAFLAPEDATHLATYEAIARDRHSDFAFGYTTNPAFAEKERVQPPSIICYRNEDNDNLALKGPFTYEDVERFLIATKEHRVIKNFREKEVETFMQRDKLTAYIFTRAIDEITRVRHELTPIAKKYEKFVVFAVVDVGRYAGMPQNFGIEMKGDEAVVVHAPGNDNLFFYEQGRRILGEHVDSMLLTILEGRASQGEVFGGEVEEADADEKHDEL